MHIFPVIILAIIQGITEFLPISSSAHLLITAEMMNIRENLSLDISPVSYTHLRAHET